MKHFFKKNVKLQITFQHFDPVWEEYVDLEEDAVMHHKDKLKAIVLPKLSDSAGRKWLEDEAKTMACTFMTLSYV